VRFEVAVRNAYFDVLPALERYRRPRRVGGTNPRYTRAPMRLPDSPMASLPKPAPYEYEARLPHLPAMSVRLFEAWGGMPTELFRLKIEN